MAGLLSTDPKIARESDIFGIGIGIGIDFCDLDPNPDAECASERIMDYLTRICQV